MKKEEYITTLVRQFRPLMWKTGYKELCPPPLFSPTPLFHSTMTLCPRQVPSVPLWIHSCFSDSFTMLQEAMHGIKHVWTKLQEINLGDTLPGQGCSFATKSRQGRWQYAVTNLSTARLTLKTISLSELSAAHFTRPVLLQANRWAAIKHQLQRDCENSCNAIYPTKV